MNPFFKAPIVAVVIMLGASSLAHAEPGECQTVEFSAELTDRFPRLREACLDVITRDGQEYAVIKANLIRTRHDGITVRVKHPDGTHGKAQFIKTSPDFRVLVKNHPTRISDLALGQELTAYVKADEPIIALVPIVEEELVFTEIPDGEPPTLASSATAMPETAGPTPVLALAGAMLMLMGGLVAVVRRQIGGRIP